MASEARKKPGVKKGGPKATHRAHVHYAGRVQGVGFRFTAEGIAHRVGLTGWVKNLPDGRVEIVCEGSKENIELFLGEVLGSALGRHIQKVDCAWESPTNEYDDFTLEFHY